MFCPQCGQERLSTETSFCSRCGFLLTGAAELLHTGGLINRALPAKSGKSSPRTRGMKQGLFILLTSVLIVPLFTVIAIATNMRSPALPLMALIILVAGGLLRVAYAAMFESPDGEPSYEPMPFVSAEHRTTTALPPQQTYPASSYAAPKPGGWRTTNDLEPPSVTDSTTKLLEKEAANQ